MNQTLDPWLFESAPLGEGMLGVRGRHRAMRQVRWGPSFRVQTEVVACYSEEEEHGEAGEASSLVGDSYPLAPVRLRVYVNGGCCHRPQIVSIRSTASYRD